MKINNISSLREQVILSYKQLKLLKTLVSEDQADSFAYHSKIVARDISNSCLTVLALNKNTLYLSRDINYGTFLTEELNTILLVLATEKTKYSDEQKTHPIVLQMSAAGPELDFLDIIKKSSIAHLPLTRTQFANLGFLPDRNVMPVQDKYSIDYKTNTECMILDHTGRHTLSEYEKNNGKLNHQTVAELVQDYTNRNSTVNPYLQDFKNNEK